MTSEKLNSDLWRAVYAQRDIAPSLYGDIDFSQIPERFTATIGDTTEIDNPEYRAKLLSNRELTDKMLAYTWMGDPVCDAYAALIPQYGFRELVVMMKKACRNGIASVENAPPELVALMDVMRPPEWIDMDLVREGARKQRGYAALFQPYMIQLGFVNTFTNVYTALPLMLTGTLSQSTARRRALETLNWYTVSTLPGQMEPGSDGFEIMGAVRLMHSMVRVNLINSDRWDVKKFGIPIPLVDQPPASIGIHIQAAQRARREKRGFTKGERASLELSRYRAYLLGSTRDLVPDNSRDLLRLFSVRGATIRNKFDKGTSDILIKATLEATLMPDRRLLNRVRDALSRGFGKDHFVNEIFQGNAKKAAGYGVELTRSDRVLSSILKIITSVRMGLADRAQDIPLTAGLADRYLEMKIRQRMAVAGSGKYESDSSQYHPRTSAKA